MDNQSKGKLGEDFVNELATQTFLSYWCFPNPHDEKGNKKEICDLLILFKDVCIICQIKNYEFKNNHDRYFRKTVESGSGQIQGAERKLFQQNKDVYIQNEKQGLIKFNKEKYDQIIRLVIHLGEGLEYQNIGRLSKSNNEFIHIVGKEDIQYLLRELNTISDFIEYLKARESLATRVDLVLGGREKDLLGLYLTIKPNFQEFIKSNENTTLFLDATTSWDSFKKEKESEENEDVLLEIESLIYDWVNNDLILNEKSRNVAEELMSLNRFERRYFAVSFLTFLKTYTDKGYTQIIRRSTSLNQIGFVFFYYPNGYSIDSIEQLMHVAAEGYALHLSYKIVNFIVIGVTENEKFNILHINLSDFKDKDPEELKNILNYLGWFDDKKMQYVGIDFNKKTKNSR
jgi:hypothetical protein